MFANSSHYAAPGENVFEWFFDNPPADEAAIVWPDLKIDIEHYPFNTRLGCDKRQLAKLRYLRNRFFRPKPELPALARSIIGPGRWLGIHYRGTDKFNEIPRVPREQVLAKVARIMDHDAIVIATDEESSAKWFKAHMPVAYLNEHRRTDDPAGLHIAHGSRQQAEEAMLDIYCLSLCDTLLLTRGNFSDMAAVFGATDDIHYQDEV